MRESNVQCLVHMPQERLWDGLSDYEILMRLASSDFRECGCSLLAGAVGSAGATYEAWMKWRTWEARYIATLEEACRPDSLLWCGCERDFFSSLCFELRPFNEGVTAVSATLSVSFQKSPRASEPLEWDLVEPAFGRVVKELQVL